MGLLSETDAMKKIIYTLVIFLAHPLFAADFYSGHWQGSGFLESQHSTARTTIKMDLRIEQKLNFLNISDCWETDLGSKCYQSHYEILNQGDVFENGNKIGDIFPQEIRIFNGHSQASEQMVFDLNGQGRLLYHYNLLNSDGILESRTGELAAQPN